MNNRIQILVNQPWQTPLPWWTTTITPGSIICVSIGSQTPRPAVVQAIKPNGLMIRTPNGREMMTIPYNLIERFEDNHLTMVDATPVVYATFVKTRNGYTAQFECPFGCQSSGRSNGRSCTHNHGVDSLEEPIARTTHCSCWSSEFYRDYVVIPLPHLMASGHHPVTPSGSQSSGRTVTGNTCGDTA